jgi:CheY-like chemotaxis protein
MNQEVIREHLSRVGIASTIAENGKIGVDMVRERLERGEKQFDLVLMDIHMPEMDGIEAAQQIALLDANVPIVALTANVMEDDRAVYASAGMKDCVGKPFTSQELWRCLSKYLKPTELFAAPANPPKKDPASAKKMFEKLEALLINNNPECMDFICELRKIRGSEILIRHIEDFNFKAALQELAVLKRG